MTDLAKDVALALAPLKALARHLSVVEKFTIDRAYEDVINICEDEEKEAQRMVDLVQELEQRLEDSGA